MPEITIALPTMQIKAIGILSLLTLLISICLPMDVWADDKPPLSDGKVVGEVLGGVVGEVLGAFVVVYTGGIVSWSIGVKSNRELVQVLGGAGILIGFLVGSAIGVYIAGNEENQTGSFGATLGGSVAGGLLGFGGVWAASQIPKLPQKSRLRGSIAIPSLLLGPPCGATIAFNLTRRYKNPPASESAHSPIYLAPIYVDLLKVRF